MPGAQNPIAPGDPAAPVAGPVATPVLPPFDQWLDGVRIEAIKRGISAETVSRALTGVEPVPQILERDRAQAEFTLTISQYFERRLTYDILKIAKQSAERHRTLLDDVEKKYGVQSRFLVAVWGLESNFGRFAGVRPMIPTLATLAYEPRRATFFRQQLFDALARRRQGLHRVVEAEWIVGGRDGSAAVHAIELSRLRAGFRWRRPPRHLDLAGGRVRVDRVLPEKPIVADANTRGAAA